MMIMSFDNRYLRADGYYLFAFSLLTVVGIFFFVCGAYHLEKERQRC
jgi:hypothetical protein